MYLVKAIGDLAPAPAPPAAAVTPAASSVGGPLIALVAIGSALLALGGVFAWSRLSGARRR